jgi:crossover junction endodeoxyribonuclease RuvC
LPSLKTLQVLEKDRVILGIDPGTNIMGYGIVRCKGKNLELISFGSKGFGRKDSHLLKLKSIFQTTLELIDLYLPDEMAIEAPFFGKNIQSMLKLGRAQGVAMAAALYRQVEVYEYSPRRIKQSITGNGNASKEQVAAMLAGMLSVPVPENLDASDGLAAAVCHSYQKDPGHEVMKKHNGWKAFIQDNPKRIL